MRADVAPLSLVATKILLGSTVDTSPAWLADATGAGLAWAENDRTWNVYSEVYNKQCT